MKPPRRREKRRVAAAENWIWNKNGGERSFVTLSGKKQRAMDGEKRGIGQGGEQREKTISSHKHFVFRFECYSRNLEYVFLDGESLDSWLVVLEGDEIHTACVTNFENFLSFSLSPF